MGDSRPGLTKEPVPFRKRKGQHPSGRWPLEHGGITEVTALADKLAKFPHDHSRMALDGLLPEQDEKQALADAMLDPSVSGPWFLGACGAPQPVRCCVALA
jgi:hypothetical protein